MKRLFLFLFALAIACTIGGPASGDASHDAATLTEIAGYRQWTRVNSEPVKAEAPVTTANGGVSILPSALD
jgi:hypothetical protein